MAQGPVTFDYQHLIRGPSTGFKLYVLFLLVACIVTSMKLVRVWFYAPPFRRSTLANIPEYLRLLETSSRSLRQWIACVFFSYGLLFSNSLYDVCRSLLSENRVGSAAIIFGLEDYAMGLSAALWVALFAFLTRWYLLKRIMRSNFSPEAESATVPDSFR